MISTKYISRVYPDSEADNSKLNVPVHVVFSDSVENGGGARLASFIEKHKLGVLVTSGARKSVRTGNTIVCYVWSPPDKITYKMKELGIKKGWRSPGRRVDDDDGFWR